MDFYFTTACKDLRPHIPNVPIMIAASSCWRETKKGGYLKIPPIPAHVTQVALDCGGYIASKKWDSKYKYSTEQYIEWLLSTKSQWAVIQDYCCEEDLQQETQKRQDLTTESIIITWNKHKNEDIVLVPTIQGLTTEDYKRHAKELRLTIQEMQEYYKDSSYFRVGIGTLCRRKNTKDISEIINMVASVLPNTPLHLFGIKLSYLQSSNAIHPQVASCDSGAWNGLFGRGRTEWKNSGQTQCYYSWHTALPKYSKKVEEELSRKKQLQLF